MSQPPRLTQIFQRDNTLTYFITFTLEIPSPVLAENPFWNETTLTLEKLVDWHVWCGVVMPDHIHFLVSPLKLDHSISNFSGAFKRWSKQSCGAKWNWQKGCFDRLLRRDEHAEQKWAYIRENPVRAGLVPKWEDWHYRIDWTNM